MTSTASAETPVVGYLVMAAVSVAFIVTLWRLFSRAGRPGWFSLIPLYNLVTLCEVAGKPAWWAALLLFPLVNVIFWLLLSLGLAKQFGKGVGYGLGLFVLGPIFYPLLAFTNVTYQGTRPQYFAARARA